MIQVRGSRIPTPRLPLIDVPHGRCSSPLGRLLSRCPRDKIRPRSFGSPSNFGQGRLCFYHFSYRKATRTRSFHRTVDVSRFGIKVRSPIVAASPGVAFPTRHGRALACTRISQFAFAIGGLPPGWRIGLADDAALSVKMDFPARPADTFLDGRYRHVISRWISRDGRATIVEASLVGKEREGRC